MNDAYINEKSLKERLAQIYKEEQLNYINEKWDKLPGKDRTFVIETLKSIYPEKSYLLKESRWYNTVGDIAGIFDPTGIIDLVNGISYWRQGDKLYAILSWISVLPILGDIIAKPVVGALKLGGDSVKMFRTAAAAGDAVKVAQAAKTAGGPVAKFVTETPRWGTTLLSKLSGSGKVSGGMMKGVTDYVKVFDDAGKVMKTEKSAIKQGVESIKTVKDLTKVGKGVKVQKPLTAAEKTELSVLTKQNPVRVFRDFGTGKNSWFSFMKSDASLGSKFSAGVPRIFGGNPATRSLMRRTKFYAGFLDWLGVANFVGPDELEEKYGEGISKKYEEYAQLPESQKLWAQDMEGTVAPPPSTVTTPTTQTSSSGGIDPVSILTKLFI
jgi:hypothetical protein